MARSINSTLKSKKAMNNVHELLKEATVNIAFSMSQLNRYMASAWLNSGVMCPSASLYAIAKVRKVFYICLSDGMGKIPSIMPVPGIKTTRETFVLALNINTKGCK